MTRVLFLNHHHEKCGIFQFGKRVYELASKSKKVDYFYRIVSNHDEYLEALKQTNPSIVLYNHHWDRMVWLKEEDVTTNKSIKHYFIYHDGTIVNNYDMYLMFGNYSPNGKNVPESKKIVLPRPLFDYQGDYPKNSVPTIGSFGFAFSNKGFPELIQLVNRGFKEAIINIHLTSPWFGDTINHVLADIISSCKKSNINPKIKLNLTTDFLDDFSTLEFLAKNDINILNYNKYPTVGLSSATDYLLSVKRPIAITDHAIFRHVAQKNILLEKNSIKEIIDRGIEPLQKYYDMWNTERFCLEMEKIFI